MKLSEKSSDKDAQASHRRRPQRVAEEASAEDAVQRTLQPVAIEHLLRTAEISRDFVFRGRNARRPFSALTL